MADDYGFRERWWAVDPKHNIARNYELSMSTDLFGWTIVERRWGRIGTKGQARRSSFAEREDALRLVTAVRRRRASARERLGVPYTPVQAQALSGSATEWQARSRTAGSRDQSSECERGRAKLTQAAKPLV